jgi:hypothetical protein
MKLNKTFSAKLQRSPKKGGWTYVVWPNSALFFGTRGLVKGPSGLMCGTLSGRMWGRESQSCWKSG